MKIRFYSAILTIALLVPPVFAQNGNPSASPSISSSGGKKRISFSYERPQAVPSPNSPSPMPSATSSLPATPTPTPGTNVNVLTNTPPAVSGEKADANLLRQFLDGDNSAPSPDPSPTPEEAPNVPKETASPKQTEEAINAIDDKALLPKDKSVTDTPATVAIAKGDAEETSPTQSVTINLIQKLVQRGILSKEDADMMVKQAEAEAEAVREQNQSDMFAIAQTAAVQVVTDQSMVSQGGGATTEEDIKVTYIPEPVRTQIREDIKQELLTEARAGRLGFGTQQMVPEWVNRIRPFVDMRFRYESINYPDGNDATGAFPNFNAINTGQPFDVTGNQFAPQYNVDQNRNRFRIRARFGAEMDLSHNLTSGLRIGTGDNNSPVTENQTVGQANNTQGGQFSKYAIWLDRAFIRYQIGEKLTKSVVLWLGRFDNPFFSTPLIWDDEVGFDGVAVQASYEIFKGVIPFLTAGAFPVFNTDLNFSSNQPQKFASYDKYLYGIQAGVVWKPSKDWDMKVATAYYYFQNIEGKLSTPYTPLTQSDAGDTDNSRPSFAQKGNTYMALRDIIPDASNDFGAINQWQYYGLATKFQEMAFTGRIDYNGFEPVQVSLIGEFVQNLAFSSTAINEIGVNNRGPNDDDLSDTIGVFDGSATAWLIDLKVGTPALAKLWDWNVGFGYRWIGSDAVVDGFNDSDFGLGGTNMQGFTVGAALALSPNLWISSRWMGANSIAGPTFDVNIFQFDVHSKF